MMKNGLDQNFLRVRGFIPRQHVTISVVVNRLWNWTLHKGIIVESVTWVAEVSLWEHEWITDTNTSLKETVELLN